MDLSVVRALWEIPDPWDRKDPRVTKEKEGREVPKDPLGDRELEGRSFSVRIIEM